MEGAAELIEPEHSSLSMRTQCKLLGIARSSLDYVPVARSADETRLKRLLDEIYMLDPSVGMAGLEAGVDRWMKHYNTWRPHQALGNETPAQTYRAKPAPATSLTKKAA